MSYDAFLSYSHTADSKLARRLQTDLGKIARPWYRRRAVRTFRDETALVATPELWPAIEQALAHSRFFLLMASPEAAASPWVNQEVEHWLSLKTPGESAPHKRLLIALTGGTICWSRSENDFNRSATTALPPSLMGAFDAEPLYVDLTWTDDPQSLTLKHKRWFDNVARLAAAIRNVRLDDLVGEDIRQHRIAIASAIASMAIVAGLGIATLLSLGTTRQLRKTTDVLVTEKKQQMDAERVLPQVVAQLDRVRNQPIRQLNIEFEPQTLFGKSPSILELQLDLNPLWTQPMSIYFAPFVEGRTWPAELDLNESPYTEFSHGRARVDAKFQWFDRTADLSQVIDGTESGVSPKFQLRFDGKEFHPGGPGIHLPHRYEIPSLQKLIDDKSRFRLIRHDPTMRNATELDLHMSGVDLLVSARYEDDGGLGDVVLLNTTRDQLEIAVSAGDALVHRGDIEQTALLHLYPPVREERSKSFQARRDAVIRLLETRRVTNDIDRRALAVALYRLGREASYHRKDRTALQNFLDANNLMEPLVFSRTPTHEDGALMFAAASELVYFSLNVKELDREHDLLRNAVAIADRMLESDPSVPQYLRWRAETLMMTAQSARARNDQVATLVALRAAIDTSRRVHEVVGNDVTRSDLMKVLEQCAMLAGEMKLDSAIVEQWRREIRTMRASLTPQTVDP